MGVFLWKSRMRFFWKPYFLKKNLRKSPQKICTLFQNALFGSWSNDNTDGCYCVLSDEKSSHKNQMNDWEKYFTKENQMTWFPCIFKGKGCWYLHICFECQMSFQYMSMGRKANRISIRHLWYQWKKLQGEASIRSLFSGIPNIILQRDFFLL